MNYLILCLIGQNGTSCGNGTGYANSCYIFVNSWENDTSASAHCASMGYHLVTITSAGENQFVTDLIKTAMGNPNSKWNIELPCIFVVEILLNEITKLALES